VDLRILGIILGAIGAVMAGHPQNTLAGIRFGITLHIVSRLLSITAGILVIFLIKGIMRRQTEKFAGLRLAA
jgi:hypothetical protein